MNLKTFAFLYSLAFFFACSPAKLKDVEQVLYPEVQILGVSQYDGVKDKNPVIVYGRIINTTNRTFKKPKIVAVFINNNPSPVPLSEIMYPMSLNPGEQRFFYLKTININKIRQLLYQVKIEY